MGYVRWEAVIPNRRATHPGVFALANGLARAGRLSSTDHEWWWRSNAWFDAAYLDPGTVDPTLFDRSVHPRTSCWFDETAADLLERVDGYLDLLDRYEVPWRARRSADPGHVLYRDAVQIVVRPYDDLLLDDVVGRSG